MEFTINGRKFVLRGAKTTSFKVINNKTFAQVVRKGAGLRFLSTINVPLRFLLATPCLPLTKHSYYLNHLLH